MTPSLWYAIVDTMKISSFKDSIIRDRQNGATFQAIADRFDCSRQHIEQLCRKWGAKEVLVPTKQERARQAVQLLIDGAETSTEKAARDFRISVGLIHRAAKKDGIDLIGAIRIHQAEKRAHRLDGQQFNGLKVVDGTCFRTANGGYFVEATCVVCGTRKVFSVSNLRAGYSKTCSTRCAHRFKRGDYTQS